jgi:pimeloyl-ACP methyl ester carboxylesterase
MKNHKISSMVSSYLLDLRNHGDSEHRATMTLNDMAEDVMHFIKENKLSNLYLMGHSLGGRVIMNMFSKYSSLDEYLKGVIIVDMIHRPLLEGISSTRENYEMIKGLAQLDIDKMNRKELDSALLKLAKSKPMVDFVRTNIKENTDKPGTYVWKSNIKDIAANCESFLGEMHIEH